MGFHYPTRMTIIRLPDDQLVVISPVELSPSLQAEVSNIGSVAHLIAPNSLHDTWLLDWHAAFPNARLIAPKHLRQKRVDLADSEELEALPDDLFPGHIAKTAFEGNIITQETVFFHWPSKTVIFTDLLQQMPKDWFSGWRRIVAYFDGLTNTELTLPKKFYMAFIGRRKAFRSLTRILAWPIENIIVAHGQAQYGKGHETVLRAFETLYTKDDD